MRHLTKNVLFVCSRNRLRSPTAEQVFAAWPNIETASAGLDNDADTPLSADLIEWADVIFVMEKVHRQKLQVRFRKHLQSARIICLDIPDEFAFMDPRLIERLEQSVPRHLKSAPALDPEEPRKGDRQEGQP